MSAGADTSKIIRDARGKFAGYASGATEIELPEYTGDPAAQRAAALAAAGYVPAVATSTRIPASSTADVKRWWGQSFTNAEYAHPAGDRLVMPDDYTPKMTYGQALSGHRRTHRMNYSPVPGVSVRMPSKTSLKRFAEEHHNRTFDVPVSATIGNRNVQGFVRVTKGADGRWDASGVEFPNKDDEIRVAESVSMALEGQRRPMGVSAAAHVSAHRAERMRAAAGDSTTRTEPVRSSWIEQAGWQDGTDREQGMMVMRTKDYTRKDGTTTSGRSYGFKIDRSTYDQFRASDRPGAVFNAQIKGQNERVEVAQCSSCGMFTTSPHNGNCPSVIQTPRKAGESDRSRMRSAASWLTRGKR